MDEREVLEELERTGALKRGHFRLSSGLHSDTYIQCAQLLRYPEMAMRAGKALAERIEGEVDSVISPALGALIIGFATAFALGVEMLFAERYGGEMCLRRGFSLEPGSRVLLVEDVVTTGGSLMEVARLVEGYGAVVVALACIVDRGGRQRFDYPLHALARLEVESFPEEECPLCARGLPLDSPGSRQPDGG